MQHFRLYLALKKYFWEFEKHPTHAEALCDAGFFSKEKLPFARRVEVLDASDGGGLSDPVTQLRVREDDRTRGYGRALMEAAEREALPRGCTKSSLITRRFQAPPEIRVHAAI
jgi:GNAT superfamily N-acetyltransferase